jgi:hypothetical protein
MLFPGGVCIFFELQIDPVSMMHMNHSGFVTFLEGHNRLTKFLLATKDYLDKKNVLTKKFSDRLTTALNKRLLIWDIGQGFNE